MADGTITIDTKIDSKDLGKQLDGVKQDLRQGVGQAAKAAAKSLAAVSVAVAGVAAASKKFAGMTDRIDKMSQKIGLSREAFQKWDFILSQSGSDAGKLQQSLTKLSRSADEAAAGTKEYAEVFDRLGISVREANGDMKEQEDLFEEVIQVLSEVENKTERTAMAQELLGRGASELAPLLNAGADGIQQMTDRAEELGLVLEDKTIQAGVDLTDAMDQVKRSLGAVAAEMFGDFAKGLAESAKGFATWATEGDRLKNILERLEPVVYSLGSALMAAFITSNIIKGIQGLTVAFKALKLTLATLNPTMIAIKAGIMAIAAAIALITRRQKRLKAEAQDAWQGLAEEVRDSKDGIEDFKESAAGISHHLGRMDISSVERMDELVGKLAKKYGVSRQEVLKIGAATEDMSEATRENLETLQDRADVQNFSAGIQALNAESQEAALRKDEIRNKRLEEYNKRKAETLRKANEIWAAQREGAFSEEEARQRVADLMTTELLILQEQRLQTGELTDKEWERVRALRARIEELQNYGAVVGGEGDEDGGGETGGAGLPMLNAYSVFGDGQKPLDAAFDLIENLSAGIKEYAPMVYDSIRGVGDSMISVFSWAIERTRAVLNWARAFDPKGAVKALKDFSKSIKTFFMKDLGSTPVFIDQGVKIIQDLLDGLTENSDAVFETIENVIDHIVQVVIEDGPKIVRQFMDLVFGIAQVVMENIPAIINSFFVLLRGVVRYLVNNSAELVDAFLTMLTEVALSIAQNINIIVEAIVVFTSELIAWIAQNVDVLIEIAIELILGIVMGIANNLDLIVEALIAAIPLIVIALIKSIPKLVEAAGRLAVALVIGIFNGIKGAISGIGKVLQVVYDAIVGGFKKLFGINSPSTVFAGLGGMLIQGLINGIKNIGSGLWNAVKGIFSGLLNGVKNLFSGAKDIGKGLVDGIKSGISSVGSGIGNVVSGIGSAASNVVSGIGSAVSGAASAVGSFFGFANGTMNAPGGLSIVGEEGPELVDLPSGTRVFTNDKTEQMLRGAGSIMAGLSPADRSPGQSMTIHNRMTGTLEVDGEAIGRVVYENIDAVAG